MTNKSSQLLFAALLLVCATFVHAQVSPFQGLGNVQFFDNNGSPLIAGVLYSFQAGTSTQQGTYTDSTGTVLNPNPIPFSSGARVSIWLTSGAFYKFTLCLQNDGPFCAPADVLFSVDQVPGSASGGGSATSPFTGTFISGSANPATSGILRLASGDTVCFRNAAGSVNLCLSKDSNDLLSWAGGALKFPEVTAPSGVALFDLLWADTAAHRWKMANNAGGAVQVVGSGVDINTSDQVNQLHFGATATPLSATPPTTNQYLQWNGTNIVGSTLEQTFGTDQLYNSGHALCSLSPVGSIMDCASTTFANAHTILRFTYTLTVSPAACATNLVIGIVDLTSATNLYTVTITNGTATGYKDSGALSLATIAGHVIGVGALTTPTGCGTIPQPFSIRMVYQ